MSRCPSPPPRSSGPAPSCPACQSGDLQKKISTFSATSKSAFGAVSSSASLDLLPAGFEIEAVVNDETAKSFPFLGELTATRVSEGRDDRFFAAFNLGTRTYRTWWDSELRNPNRFNVAYIVRAVTPGSFALPAVNVSDMYAPRIHARSAMGRVTIAPR